MTHSETRQPVWRGIAPGWTKAALQAAEAICVLAAVGLWAIEQPPQGLILLGAPLWVAAWFWRWLRPGRPTRRAALPPI